MTGFVWIENPPLDKALTKILQKDYTLSSLYYQIKLPLDLEILIPADDPVRYKFIN